ncbi:MAG: hypothetical protein GXO76_03510 [Calditrichaeota bacterium]|nr:hypothetical protein [Calditrichota bacterium]
MRHLKRYQEILRVMVKYGFDDIVERIKIGLIFEVAKSIIPRIRKNKYPGIGTGPRLRMAFQELGPTFIKLGQLLSLRPDLIPPTIAEELTKLQDAVPPVQFELIKSKIEEEFSSPLHEIFSEFQEESLAAASMAQVHRATLKTGEDVAVKILRPNIHKIIKTDIEILFSIAELIEKYIPESRLYDLVGIVKEFSKAIQKEENLSFEGRNIDSFRRYFKRDKTMKLPLVYWPFTTEDILVMEFINGVKISDAEGIERLKLDRKKLAYNAAKAMLKEIFEYGIFHADPHPGNIFVLPGNVIAPVDFGMVGRIDDEMREYLLDILEGIVQKDVYKITQALLGVQVVDTQINKRELSRDLLDFLDRYYGVPLNQLDSGKLVNEFMELIRTYKIKLPADLVMMERALVISEAVGRQLYPEFNYFDLLIPYVRKQLILRLNPARHYRAITRSIDQISDILKRLPDDIQSFLAKVRNNQLTVRFHHEGLDDLRKELDRSSNRISFSLIVAALIIGSSLIINIDKGPHILGYPVLGIIGFLLASILGFWLLVAILRSGKL